MNDIDTLMRKPALELTSQDIDDIVAFHRESRGKPKVRDSEPGVDLRSLIKIVPKAVAPGSIIKRRV